MPETLLALDQLRVDFPEVVAVDNLSFSIESGDVCGLIGPNGAGKTTTMRVISGLQEFTRGRVRVGGHDLSQEPDELKRQLGFMPDFCPVYEQLTAAEFLEHFARAFNVTNREQRINECLELTWLTDKRDSLGGELSRGMKQRLVLAKTLLPDPQVLLLDEPASGLDPLGRIELRKILLHLRETGKAVLISSHILTELSGFCNKAAIMERGKLIKFGTLAELGRQMNRRRMSIKWRTGDERPAQILGETRGVNHLEVSGQSAVFDFDGEMAALDDVLKHLILEGIRVCEWHSVEDDLEQIFLQSGAKELM